MKFSEDTRTLAQKRDREQEKSDSHLVVSLRHVSVQWVRLVSDRCLVRRYPELITATKVPQLRFK
jgi:hypothetical protein